jgi:tyrosine-protein kinase Etk/Wzc
MLNNNYSSKAELNGVENKTENFRLLDLWDVLWSRKKLVFTIFGLTLIATAYFTLNTKPQYLAAATMMIEPGDDIDILKDNAPAARSLGLTNRTRIANYVEILKSTTLAQKVLTKLNPEVQKRLHNPHFHTTSELITKLKNSLSVRNLRETDIIQVQFQAGAPDLAQELTNAYASTYQEYELDQTRANVRSIREFIEKQLTIVGNRLDSAEKELELFKRERKLVSLSAETEAAISRQSNFQILLEQTRTDRKATEEQLVYIKNLLEKDQKTLPIRLENISSPLIASLKSTLNELEGERTNLLLQGFNEAHPRIKSLEQRIKEIKNRLSQESSNLVQSQGTIDPLNRIQSLIQRAFDLDIESERLKSREKVLSNLVEKYESELTNLPVAERNLAKLTRQVDVNREVYVLLSQRYEEVRISEVGKIPTVRIIDWASKGVKVKPNVPLNIVMGLILAIGLAIGTGLSFEYLDTTLKHTEDVEKILPVVLANIPDLRSVKSNVKRARGTKNSALGTDFLTHRHILSSSDSESGGAEAFRMLRTALLYSRTEQLKTLIVTSPGVSEGKSTIAVNLAVVLAQGANKTLLIDADLRRPVLHSVFRKHKHPGFTDAVVTAKPESEIIHPTGIENLDIITCGTIPPSPADILNSKATTELLERLKNNYDFIIIDTPPTLVAADTAILASKTDGVVLTVRANKTTREALAHTQKVLMAAGAKFIGGVINCLKAPKRYGYYYNYKYSLPKEQELVNR